MALDTMNRKAAPRRSIERVDRIGTWGNIVYRHSLDCGHREDRKRPATTPTMACTTCAAPPPPLPALIERPEEPDLADSDWTTARLTAAICGRLGVSTDAVSAWIDPYSGVAQLTVVLSPSEITTLT